MNRRKFTTLILTGAALLPASVTVGRAAGQTPRPRLSPAVRGVARLAYTKPAVKNAKIEGRDFIVTTFQVKNLETAAIAGLRVEEFWYNNNGDAVTGDDYRHRAPLQPGEIITITLEVPRTQGMTRNQYQFTHANGDIEPELQGTL